MRDGVDDFYNIIKGGVEYYTEPGGIHAGLVYVECLDYISKQGAERAIKGDFKDKFAYNLVAKFINEQYRVYRKCKQSVAKKASQL